MRPSSRFLRITAALLACVALGASACGEEDATVRERKNGTGEIDGGAGDGGTLGCGAAVLSSYVAPNFAANAQAELALGKSLDDLDAKMASTEGNATATVTSGELSAIYNAGTLSLRNRSTQASVTLVDGYLLAFGNAQGKTWQPSDAQADGGATTGGKFNGLFYESAAGVDLRAATNKAILGGALYNYALLVLSQGITSDAVDKLVAVYGATPAFANTTDVNAGANGDRLVAALAAKRDDKSGTGIYSRARQALFTMKAAAGNSACQTELTAAANQFKLAWEQATYASAIFALNAASVAASKADGPLALHSYGEALGLIQSFKGIPGDQRKIQDAQIDTLLGFLHPETAYVLVTDPAARVNDLGTAINNIKLFEFPDTDIEPFKVNH